MNTVVIESVQGQSLFWIDLSVDSCGTSEKDFEKRRKWKQNNPVGKNKCSLEKKVIC